MHPAALSFLGSPRRGRPLDLPSRRDLDIWCAFKFGVLHAVIVRGLGKKLNNASYVFVRRAMRRVEAHPALKAIAEDTLVAYRARPPKEARKHILSRLRSRRA